MKNENPKDDSITMVPTEVETASVEDGTATVDSEDTYYSTGKVSEMLGVSRDMIRNHIKDFEEYLDVTRSNSSGKGSHVRLRASDVELLENIISLRKTRSVEQTKELLNEPSVRAMFLKKQGADVSLKDVILKSNELVIQRLMEALSEHSVKENQLLIEQQDNLIAANAELRDEVSQLKETLLSQNQQLAEQKAALEKLIELSSKEEKKGFFSSLFKK